MKNASRRKGGANDLRSASRNCRRIAALGSSGFDRFERGSSDAIMTCRFQMANNRQNRKPHSAAEPNQIREHLLTTDYMRRLRRNL